MYTAMLFLILAEVGYAAVYAAQFHGNIIHKITKEFEK